MLSELVDALKAAPTAYAAGIAVVAAILKSGKALLQFHDEYLRTRPFKRLSYLASECVESESLSKLIVAAKHELVFREIFDATASPRFIAAMDRLLQSGRFSLTELRASSFYLRLREGEVAVELGVTAAVLFWMPLLLVLAMGAYVGVIVAALLATKSFAGVVAVVVIFTLFIFFAWLFGRDARAVYVARSVRKKLKELRSET